MSFASYYHFLRFLVDTFPYFCISFFSWLGSAEISRAHKQTKLTLSIESGSSAQTWHFFPTDSFWDEEEAGCSAGMAGGQNVQKGNGTSWMHFLSGVLEPGEGDTQPPPWGI